MYHRVATWFARGRVRYGALSVGSRGPNGLHFMPTRPVWSAPAWAPSLQPQIVHQYPLKEMVTERTQPALTTYNSGSPPYFNPPACRLAASARNVSVSDSSLASTL